MIENYVHSTSQKILVKPLVGIIAKRTSCLPIHLSVAAIISGVLCALALVIHLPVLAVILLLLSGYLDMLDGGLARHLNLHSARGAVLDIVGDRVVEFAVIFGLFCIDPIGRAGASIWMLGATLICITSFLVVGIFSENHNTHKSFHYSPGLIERAEAFAFFMVMMLIPGWFLWLAWLYVLLVLFTAGRRVYEFYQVEG